MNQEPNYFKKKNTLLSNLCQNNFIGKIKNIFTVCKYSNIKFHLNFLYLKLLEKNG